MKFCNLTLDVADDESMKQSAIGLCCDLKPDLVKDEIQVEELTGGTTNKILMVRVKKSNDKMLIRVYGLGSEVMIDRHQEIENMDLLSKAGLGSKLLGVFNNGICYQYLEGQSITREMVSSPDIYPLVARKLANMHLIKIEQRTNILWDRMRNYIDLLPESFQDSKQDNLLNKQELLYEYAMLKELLENCSSPLVFCHNDLNIPNILFDGSDVSFIDVEYGGCSYAAFDVANHFVQFAGGDPPLDYVRYYPSKQFQLKWIQEYLQTFNETCSPEDVEELYDLVQKFALCSHLFWSVWALVQAKISSLDYDFLDAAIEQLSEYKRMKMLVLKTTQIG
eukprot:GFUD01006834.1.p1 GENE.GFUD01006834.1~~GFUD01006834.1.p1  ORF type:complete len:336 (-),score=72.11 GFUD01006834.1:162-1169(-)